MTFGGPPSPDEPSSSKNFDALEDPLARLEFNEKQGLQAFWHVLFSIVAMVLTVVAVVAIADLTGDECPDTGVICTTPHRVEVVVLPTLVGLILSVAAGWRTYSRWRDHIRWRPWLFATYAMWIATTACLLLTSSVVFVQTS